MFVERQSIAKPEFRVVLEQRIGPGGSASVGIHRPRRRRQVAAINGGTACRVRHEEPVAKELTEQAQVRRFAAAGTGARVLEQRRQILDAPDERRIDSSRNVFRQRFEERQIGALALQKRSLRRSC